MPTPQQIKAYTKACTDMVTAQQLLIRHQIEMERQRRMNAIDHIKLTERRYGIDRDPSLAPLLATSIERWTKGLQTIAKMQAKLPKLIMAYQRAQKRFDEASRNMD